VVYKFGLALSIISTIIGALGVFVAGAILKEGGRSSHISERQVPVANKNNGAVAAVIIIRGTN
jgi:hypothetical protein